MLAFGRHHRSIENGAEDYFRSSREDVYAARWEGKNGKSGYSPACRNEWDRAFCGKPKVKCAECEYRQFLPLTDQVVYDHLAGKHTVGIYPLLPDETCWFLAADFDKASWQEDVAIFLGTCDEMGVPAALERSRSGSGSHIWIFFERPIPAHLARKLGCALLTRTIERRHQIGLDSYDRLFPNQDTMPKGGFGNLIALPLQRRPRDQGNSLFLDRDFQPYPDQWEFLSTLRKMRVEEVETLVMEAARAGSIIGVRLSLIGAGDEEEEENPWTLPPSKKRKSEKPITGPLPEKVRIIQSNLLYIEKEGLPPALLSRLVRLAAFQNPEFYKAQAMRLPTFGKPRVIGCAEDFPRHIGLPRGCLDDILELLNTHGIKAESLDERFPGTQIEVTFRGELRLLQQQAADAILPHDNGILCATTAFGKTVVAAWIIAARQVNTLILVHRRQLMDQWRERLAAFLDLALDEALRGYTQNGAVLRGGMGVRQRRAVAQQLAAIPDGEERVLVATGRYIGEGFDDARLDTLFLALPISWRGTLQQYAGRLHRIYDNKHVVQIYDYVDIHVPMLMRMYERRLKGYRAIGYLINDARDTV